MEALTALKKDLLTLANPQKAQDLQRFFKTGPGQYGEGDVFLGITVPKSHLVATKYKDLPLSQIGKLLKSKIHEERLIALLILVGQFKKGTPAQREKIFRFYLKSTPYINNWDLVDLSAHKIVGEYLLEKDTSTLDKLARSQNLWEKRIAIVATFQFIAAGKLERTLEISRPLLSDPHDLIHKAIGWMLREVGKKDQKTLEDFLKQNYKNLPRTTLRYAIERFSPALRQKYLSGKIGS